MVRVSTMIGFVPAVDRHRLLAFYRDVLGLRHVRDDGTAHVLDSGGTMLRIVEVAALMPQPFTIVGWEVDDLDVAVAQLEGAGVELAAFEFVPEPPIWEAPNGDRVAWLRDTEGNLVSLSQHAEPLA